MRLRQTLAIAALLGGAAAAHAEHFEYSLSLHGTYSQGGTEGCYPPDFDQPACPVAGSMAAMLSFDTPGSADGSWSIEGGFGDITDFTVTLGSLNSEDLYGGVNLVNGMPNGIVQPLDQSETFTFDWGTRSAFYSYDFGYHGANGTFSGTLSAVPEPALSWLLLTGIAVLAATPRRRSRSAGSA